MKPASFRYLAVDHTDHLFAALAAEGDGAQIIAGGQSLVPMMALRLASPNILIDVNPVAALAGVRLLDDGLEIGAMTRYRALEEDATVGGAAPLLHLAMPLIAHPAIRNRGTIGGSIALADPAAELPACCLCLDAEFVLGSAGGRRVVPASAFFLGLYRTALQADEAVLAVRIPPTAQQRRATIREVARRHGDYAIAGVAASAQVTDGRMGDLRLACFGISDCARLAAGAAALLELEPSASAAALSEAIAADIDIVGDDAHPAALRRHLVGVLARRAAADLLG